MEDNRILEKMSAREQIENYLARKAYEKFYICEPSKNDECNKNSCWINGGPCYMVKEKKYAKD